MKLENLKQISNLKKKLWVNLISKISGSISEPMVKYVRIYKQRTNKLVKKCENCLFAVINCKQWGDNVIVKWDKRRGSNVCLQLLTANKHDFHFFPSHLTLWHYFFFDQFWHCLPYTHTCYIWTNRKLVFVLICVKDMETE